MFFLLPGLKRKISKHLIIHGTTQYRYLVRIMMSLDTLSTWYLAQPYGVASDYDTYIYIVNNKWYNGKAHESLVGGGEQGFGDFTTKSRHQVFARNTILSKCSIPPPTILTKNEYFPSFEFSQPNLGASYWSNVPSLRQPFSPPCQF